MDGLFFFVAVSESDRQMRHGLNGATPHGNPTPFATPGLLARLRARFQVVTNSHPLASETSHESGQSGLGHAAPSSSR